MSKMKIKNMENMLEEAYPEKTPLAIQIMLRGWEYGKKELLKKLQGNKNPEEIIQIIQEFK